MRPSIKARCVAFVCCLSPGSLWAQLPTPVATCVEYDTVNHVMIAHFGASLPAGTPNVTIPVGPQNYVTPMNARVYGQPSVFRSGMKLHSFLVVEPGPQTAATYATWTLGALSATLNATAMLCPQKPAACWDTNHSDKCDLDTEDINGDGACTIADCAGPAGETGSGGLAGPTGIPGPAGPQGPSGDSAFPSAFRLASVTGTSDSAVVSCLAGERLLSGGAVCAVPNRTTNSGRIAASGPSGTNAWMVTCSVGQATAVAVCASTLGGN